MKQVVRTHFPGEEAPIEWALTADGVLILPKSLFARTGPSKRALVRAKRT